MNQYYDQYESPLGSLYIVVDEIGVQKIEMIEENWNKFIAKQGAIAYNPMACKAAIKQLEQYFSGKRKRFEVPMSMVVGTSFQREVWKAVSCIPYGETRSYLEIATAIGRPKAVRAVGQANRVNPLPILIPCHRVIGKSGKLVGYAGTRTDLKSKLLQIEGVCAL